MKRLLLTIFFSILFCGQVFADGNIIDKETYDKVSVSNIIYSNKTEALLLKTGQITSYHADDDGDLELGIAHSFTVLTTGQYAGSTNVTINSKTHVTSNACVQNNNTNDMWLREVIQADIGPDGSGKLFWEQYTLAAETCTCNATNKTITADAGTPFDTGALCAGRIFTILGSALGNNGTFTIVSSTTSVLTVSESVTDEASIALDFASVNDTIWCLVTAANSGSGIAGYTDWRIPNRRELESIVDIGCTPVIDTTVFPSTPSTYHWTGTTNFTDVSKATIIRFSEGLVNTLNKGITNSHVRLIR